MTTRIDFTTLSVRESEQVEWKANVADTDDVVGSFASIPVQNTPRIISKTHFTSVGDAALWRQIIMDYGGHFRVSNLFCMADPENLENFLFLRLVVMGVCPSLL